MTNHNDYRIRIRKNKTNLRIFFEVMLYDANYKVIENIYSKSRMAAYITAYKLMVKHCSSLGGYEKFYLAMRLLGYYSYIVI